MPRLQMAKLLGANPRTTFDNWRERAKERGISLATYVERRYVASFGNTDPMKHVSPAPKKSKRQRLAARGEAKLTLTLPAKLVRRMESRCASEGLKLAEEIQALLEARFPAKEVAPPEVCPSDEAAPMRSQGGSDSNGEKNNDLHGD